MSQFVINGGHELTGTIEVYGSKNAALPLIAAALLTPKPVTLHNIPAISDVQNMLSIAQAMGVRVSQEGTTVTLTADQLAAEKLPTEKVSMLRGSILLMGALLGRTRKVHLPKPGGDLIGARPLTAHLDAFRQLGATISQRRGYITIDGSTIAASHVILSEFSVTATENVLLLAATLPGTTTIEIAACEPHVVALAELLTAMGATITGAGTHTITVAGNPALHGATVTNIPDMLEAGSFILLGIATQSTLTVKNAPCHHLALFFKKLDDIGLTYEIGNDGDVVTVHPSTPHPFKMQSLPYPGIPTDLQAPFSVIATQAKGTSLIHDPLYESRFRHITELQKMGAVVTVCDPHRVIIHGPTKLRGRRIPSLDVRSGMTLLIAGLAARGQTIIENAEIIDRGYAKLTERLQTIGASIKREGD